ncbi:Hypothetical protein ADU71_1274 [Pediococcus damnosus]|uniref:hypothetical protein n=1 Tax=Pediococcus damnosus TaxID=51663 RepID=UPI00078E5308|nr:hypothetical protein [Pediococcus damnosus]AMV65170.1 Hypothetical protein ADU71_1274 [Pediococcus damnosus]
MAIFGNLAFWGLILFCIIAVSFKAGKDTGITEEQQRHNRIIWQDSEEYYLNQRNK